MSLRLIFWVGHYARHGDQHGRSDATDLGADQGIFGRNIGGGLSSSQRGGRNSFIERVLKRFGELADEAAAFFALTPWPQIPKTCPPLPAHPSTSLWPLPLSATRPASVFSARAGIFSSDPAYVPNVRPPAD